MTDLIHNLLAAAVHDNKNLMQALLGAIDNLAQRPDAAPLAGEIAALRRLAQRLVDNSMQVLGVYDSGLDGDGFQVSYDTVALDDFLLEAQSYAQTLAATRDDVAITVEALLDDAAPGYWIFDPALVELALHGALENAVAFAKATVVISASVVNDMLEFWVEDDGPGPGAEPASPRPASTGLGLTIADALLRAHTDQANGRHGSLEMGRAPKGGTRITLRLP